MKKPKSDNSDRNKGSCSDLFNEMFRKLESYEEMMNRNVAGFLKLCADLKLSYNLSDVPKFPNPLFLEDNQIYLLVPYLPESVDKNGCQRSFDNLFLILSPESFSRQRRSGRNLYVSDIRNSERSSIDYYKPGLRWVKFGVYKSEDVDGDADYQNSIKRKAGLELLVFLCYYRDHLDYFIKYFGRFDVSGYNYLTSNGSVSDYLAYVHRNEEDTSKIEISLTLSAEADKHCMFLVDDLV